MPGRESIQRGFCASVVTLNAHTSTIAVSGYFKSSGVSSGLGNDYSTYSYVAYANGGIPVGSVRQV